MSNNVPKLRFKGFSDEWEEKRIGDITYKVGSGKTPKGGSSVYTDEGVTFIRSQNVLDGKLSLKDVAYITEEENEKMKSTKIMPKDVLLNITGASIGRSCIVPDDFTSGNINQHVCIIRVKDDNPRFIMDYIISDKIQKQICSYQAGGNREGLNFEQIKGMKLAVPSLEEQEKIANFLTKVDKIIEKQEEKVSNLESYKKGMMQKIFSQEIRFKDENGQEYPSWEVKKFSEILINSRLGGNYDNTEIKTHYPLIKMGNIGRGRVNLTKIEYICNDNDIDDNDRLRLGDLLFNTRNTLDLVGKVSIWKNELEVAYYNSNILRLTFNNNYFMNYVFNSYYILSQLKSIATGTTSVAAIYTRDLNNIIFNMPCLEEQSKIANFLSNIDEVVEKEKEKLKELRLWKKGLLQQIFV